MITKQFEIEVGWGKISGQIFSNSKDISASQPIIALHGFLDNSNSFKPIAPHITNDNKYHIIAVDLPGMGLSSKVPQGIPYSTKLYVMSLRRVVNYFDLKKFVFLTHSFGCSIGLAYSACWPDEVSGISMIDFAMKDCNIDNRDNIGECWRDGIDVYLKAEKDLQDKLNNNKNPEKQLTYDHALSRLLESNKNIDENAAKILLERGLVVVNDKYEYSRDIRLVAGISMRDYHMEFHGIYDCLFKTLNSPVILIYATPPPYGNKLYGQIMQIMGKIAENSKSTVDLIPFEGTHHFHMLKPVEASKLVLNFLETKCFKNDNN